MNQTLTSAHVRIGGEEALLGEVNTIRGQSLLGPFQPRLLLQQRIHATPLRCPRHPTRPSTQQEKWTIDEIRNQI
jgi:hypothetical protein